MSETTAPQENRPADAAAQGDIIETDLPGRLDRLPWDGFTR